MLQTPRKDNNLSRWHSQRQVQDCYEWCFWSLPKCQMYFLNLYLTDLGIHKTIWSTIEMMEEKEPQIYFHKWGKRKAPMFSTNSTLCFLKAFHLIQKNPILNLWSPWIKAGYVLQSRKGKKWKGKLRQSKRADTEATEFILHCSASLNKIILQDAWIRELHLQESNNLII